MLLYLHEHLADDLDGLSSTEWNALELLAQAALEGKHHVLVSRKLCSAILERGSLFSQRSLAFYRRHKANASTNGYILIHQAAVYGVILRNSSVTDCNTEHSNAIVFYLEYFSQTDSVQPFVFACEDSNDCAALYHLSLLYRSNLRLQSHHVQLNRIHGGGSGLSRVVRQHAEEARPMLVITDSDKKHRTDNIGSTSRKVQLELDRAKNPYSYHLVLQCREAENLMPDTILAKLNREGTPRPSDLIFFMSRAGCEELRLFSDFKKGVRLNELFLFQELIPQEVESLIEYTRSKSGNSLHPYCLANSICRREHHCECIVLQPMGDKILPSLTDFLSSNGGIRDCFHGLCEKHQDELRRILSWIVYWGLAMPRSSA